MLRLLTALSVLLALSLASAQDGSASKLKIVFGADGQRQVWFLDGEMNQVGDRTDATGTSVELDEIPSGAKYVATRDMEGNQMARREIAPLKGVWPVSTADWSLLYEVNVSVVHEFEPVQSGLVTLKAGDYEEDVLLSPEDKGGATFHAVPDRQMSVTFSYKHEGEQKTTPRQTFALDDAALAAPTLTISVSDPVATVGEDPEPTEPTAPATGGGAAPAQQTETAPRSNFWQKFIGMIIGLALLGGVIYGLIWYFKNKPETAKDLLTKAGIQVPDDGADDGSGDADPPAIPSQPEPLKKIILDQPVSGDPQSVSESVATNLGAAAAASPGAMPNPRFVREDGSVFLIPEGSSTVGREADRDFALTGESSVSRTHAEVSRTGDTVTVTDQGSTNGTWINGAKAEGAATLKPGDMITFGGVHCTYEV